MTTTFNILTATGGAMALAVSMIAIVNATQQGGPASESPLVNSSWKLLSIRTTNGETAAPKGEALYTIAFGADGRVNVRVDCNRGGGTWTSTAPGQIEFGPIGLTRAMCPPGSLHDRVASDMQAVRSYALRDGHLMLSLASSDTTYEYEPLPKAPAAPPQAAPAASRPKTGPSFDCSKVSGAAERLICGDPILSRLDRELSAVYAESLKKAETLATAPFRTDQRAWLVGRDNCGKETDIRACVEREYVRRVTELQAKSQLVKFTGPATYTCTGANGKAVVPNDQLTATFYETVPPSAIFERGGKSIVAMLAPAASGTKYDSASLTFWEHQGEAQVTWQGTALKCKVRK